MIKGECLCGAVQFEVASVVGPFELCHCNRCRKSSGSAYAAIVGVAVEGSGLLLAPNWFARSNFLSSSYHRDTADSSVRVVALLCRIRRL